MNRKKTRVVFVGCVVFSNEVLKSLLKFKTLEIVGIVTKKNSKFNSDFLSLANIAEKKSIPFFFNDNKNTKELFQFIKSLNPELGFCIGWSNILDKSILEIPKLGFIGYHPTNLPKNRGRNPIVWSIFLGLKNLTSTFFKINKLIDGGDIINKKKINISKNETAKSLYSKMCETAVKQINYFLPKYLNSKIKLKKQNLYESNFWRKRDQIDGIIDWRMSFSAINNLVRALSKPYIGASTFYKNKEYIVWNVKKGPNSNNNFEPGKIIMIKNKHILIKCWRGSVWITDHNFKKLPNKLEYLR